MSVRPPTYENLWLWGLVGGMAFMVVQATFFFCFIYIRKAKSPPVQPPLTPPPTPRSSIKWVTVFFWSIIVLTKTQKFLTLSQNLNVFLQWSRNYSYCYRQRVRESANQFPSWVTAYRLSTACLCWTRSHKKVVPPVSHMDETNQPLNGAVESSSSSLVGASLSLGYRNSPASPGNGVGLPCYKAGTPHCGAAENA